MSGKQARAVRARKGRRALQRRIVIDGFIACAAAFDAEIIARERGRIAAENLARRYRRAIRFERALTTVLV